MKGFKLLIGVVIVVISAFITFLNLETRPTFGRAPHRQDTNLENKTSGIQVEGVEITDGFLTLRLTNQYQKGITGYTIGIGKDSRAVIDYTIANRVIAPGQTDELKIGQRLNGNEAIRILSVIFDDGTTDGDPAVGAELRDRRLGLRTQLKRILPLLKTALAAQDVDAPAAVEPLRSRIEQLESQPPNGFPDNSTSGLHDMKIEVLSDLNDLEQRYGLNHPRRLVELLQQRLITRDESLSEKPRR